MNRPTPAAGQGGRRANAAPSRDPSLSRARRIRRYAWIGGVLVFVLSGAVLSVASSLDAACATCHAPQASSVRDSAHANVSCYGCHLDSGAWGIVDQKAAEFFRMYSASLRGVQLTGPGRRVSRTVCVRCHTAPPAGVFESQGLRIRHETCAPPPSPCDSCHNTVAHGEAVRWARQPVMEECLSCHQEHRASTACDSCHAGKLERQRLVSGPWQVTHGGNWQETHGMGDLQTCAACHEASKCVKCHGTEIPHPEDFMNEHGARSRAAGARCTGCHRTRGWCLSCHGVPMPHPKGFLKDHSRIATGYEDAKCRRCHAQEDCVNCHEAHTHPGTTEGSLSRRARQGGGRP